MGRRDLKLNWWLKQRPRPMLCCSKVDGGILIGSLLQVNRYLHIGRPISTAPCVASPFAGRGAASAASIGIFTFRSIVRSKVLNGSTKSVLKVLNEPTPGKPISKTLKKNGRLADWLTRCGFVQKTLRTDFVEPFKLLNERLNEK